MNEQDNPHAKGLSVNQDVITEDYCEPKPKSYDQKFHEGFVKKLLSEPTTSEKSQEEWQKDIDECKVSIEYGLDTEIDRAVQQWKRMRCSVNPIIDIKRVTSFFPSVLKETVSWYYSQLTHFNRVIPIMELDGSGLALTNPEE